MKVNHNFLIYILSLVFVLFLVGTSPPVSAESKDAGLEHFVDKESESLQDWDWDEEPDETPDPVQDLSPDENLAPEPSPDMGPDASPDLTSSPDVTPDTPPEAPDQEGVFPEGEDDEPMSPGILKDEDAGCSQTASHHPSPWGPGLLLLALGLASITRRRQ